ncbi:TonB-dependent receptor [Weeksellaceae bacterium TAE3-ERU29]|nr:TonB-dependent receptor [Weeksellaceae bacterium TAE3-ERU29]
MLRKLTYLLLIIFCGQVLYAQCPQGIYIFNEKGEQLKEYEIEYKNRNYKCTSNKFPFLIGEGDYLIIKKEGYLPERIKVSNTLKKIVLKEKTNQLELNPLVVTGTRTMKPLSESAIYTRVITTQEIMSGGNIDLESVLEREIPAITFTNHAGVPNIQLHGLGGNRVLFLLNGERIAGETRNNIDYSLIDVNDIEKIEVVQGASSTLYGSGAIGGVINIITKVNTKSRSYNLSTFYNSDKNLKSSVSGSVNLNKFYLKTGIRFNTNKEKVYEDRGFGSYIYDNGNVKIDSVSRKMYHRAKKLWSVQQEIGYKVNDDLKLNLKADHYERYQERPGAEKPIVKDNYRSTGIIFSSNWAQSPTWNHQLFYNYNYYTKEEEFLKVNEKNENYKSNIHNFKYLLNYKKEKINWLNGVEYINDGLKTYMFLDKDIRSAYTLSALSEVDWNFVDKAFLVGGLRIDKHQYYGVAFTPKIALKHNLWRNINARWNFSTGFRSPTLKELYTDWDHLGIFRIIGNKELQPEKSNNYMLTIEKEGKKVYASVSLFKSDIGQKIGMEWNNASHDTLYYRNYNKQKLWGIDFISKININRDLRLSMGYSYTGDKKIENGRNFSDTRPHSANFNVNYKLPISNETFGVNLSCSGNYHSKLDLYSEDDGEYYKIRYPAYFLMDLNAILKYKNFLSVNIGAENALNYKPKNYDFYTPIVDGVLYKINVNINLN